MSSFDDPQAVARYTDGPLRQVPGLHALHQMTGLLLHECVPAAGRVLVLGAGGGMELRAFAEAYPQWRLLGIDPSAPMLELAVQTLGSLAPGVELLEGYIDAAPATEVDGAVCLLTMHFLSVDERLHTLRELRRRLKPGAPLVMAHHSVPDAPDEKRRWLQRHVAFMAANGMPVANKTATIEAMASRLPTLSPRSRSRPAGAGGLRAAGAVLCGFHVQGVGGVCGVVGTVDLRFTSAGSSGQHGFH